MSNKDFDYGDIAFVDIDEVEALRSSLENIRALAKDDIIRRIAIDGLAGGSRAAPEPVRKAVERILDEQSAWISRPSPDVTKRIALSATVAAQRIIEEMALKDQCDLSEIEARVRRTICPTWSSDESDQGSQGRISENDFNVLMALARVGR